MTPAQAYGHPTLDDVPVQGPTDPGMRAADCLFAQTRLPVKNPACVDCTYGPGLGESISLGGSRVSGFGIGDGDIFAQLSTDQKNWVLNAINTLNTQIVTTTKTTCPTWAADIQHMSGCFQLWYNATYGKSGASITLRTDGVFDQATFDALKMISSLHPGDFPAPPPQPPAPPPQTPVEAKKGLSTGAIVGITAAGAVVIGGVLYVITRKS